MIPSQTIPVQNLTVFHTTTSVKTSVVVQRSSPRDAQLAFLLLYPFGHQSSLRPGTVYNNKQMKLFCKIELFRL